MHFHALDHWIKNCTLWYYFTRFFISNTKLKLAKNQVEAKQHPEAKLLLSENYSLCSSKLSSKNNKQIFLPYLFNIRNYSPEVIEYYITEGESFRY